MYNILHMKMCKICGKELKKINYSEHTVHCTPECLVKDEKFVEFASHAKTVASICVEFKIHHRKVERAIKLLGLTNKFKLYKEKVEKECKYCKTLFRSDDNLKHFCSHKCAVKHVTESNIKPREHVRARKRFNDKMRKMRKKNALSENANKKILQLIYKNVPEGYQVDHIIPISKGGLHHEDNLQYLPASENFRKSNKLDYEPKGVIKWQDLIKIEDYLTGN